MQVHEIMLTIYIGNVFKWLEHHHCDQHGLSLKHTCTVLLCASKRHFMGLCPA